MLKEEHSRNLPFLVNVKKMLSHLPWQSFYLLFTSHVVDSSKEMCIFLLFLCVFEQICTTWSNTIGLFLRAFSFSSMSKSNLKRNLELTVFFVFVVNFLRSALEITIYLNSKEEKNI